MGAGQSDSIGSVVRLQVTHGLSAYDGLSLPEDTETVTASQMRWTHSYLSDDEDMLADSTSGGEPRIRGWEQRGGG